MVTLTLLAAAPASPTPPRPGADDFTVERLHESTTGYCKAKDFTTSVQLLLVLSDYRRITVTSP